MRLKINTFISLCAVILILLSLIVSLREFVIAERDMELLDNLRKVSFERTLLRDEYLLYQEERAKAQWYAKSESLRYLLGLADTRFEQEEEKALLQDARKDFDATFSGMSRIMEGHARQGLGKNKKLGFSDAELQLARQVSLKAYSLTDNINRLHELFQKETANARNKATLIVVLFILGGIIAIITNSTIINRTIAKQAMALSRGVERIGSGDFDHRIPVEGDDELSALALGTNEMAAKLKELHTSGKDMQREIESRKAAEETAQNLFLRSEAILAAVPDIIMEVDNRKVYVWANQAGLSFFGDEVIGKEAAAYFEGEQDTYQAVQPLFNGQPEVIYVESWQRRKDGEKRLLAWWCRALKDADGNVIGALSSARDITEQKRVQEALRESQAKLSEVHKMAQLGHWRWDVRTGKVEWSEEVYKIFRLDPDKFTPQIDAIQSLSPWPEDHERDKELIRRALESHKKGNYEQRFLRPDGSIGYYYSTFQGKYDDNGDLISIVGTVLDITKRKQAELLLKESQERLAQILSSTVQGIYGLDSSGNCTFCNPACIKMLRYRDEQELLGKNMHELIHHTKADGTPFPKEECIVLQSLRTGEHLHSGQELIWRADGSSFPVEYWAYPILKDTIVQGTVISFVDRTEQVSLENQLRHSQKMEAIGTLASGIAHDFNNILSAIIGYGHVALMTMSRDDPQRLNIERILESADRAAALTQNLLTFSRKQALDRRPIDLNKLLRRVEQFLARIIGEDVDIHMVLDDDRVLNIFADAGQLEQVLMNLATNARDAMPQGGSFTIETTIMKLDESFVSAHGYGKPGNYAMLAATDTGIGMNEETRKKAFDPFFTTKEVGKGTGLGLPMAYGIIKQHDGFINVYSEPGMGTTIKVYLPLTQKAGKEEQEGPVAEYPKGGTETVLLAEDDANVRKLMALVLEQMGYHVISAHDGVEAMSKFQENKDKIGFLLLDVMMPKKGGREVFEEIRKVRPDMPTLFVSGYSATMLRERAMIEKGMDILYKPITMVNLLKKVREILDKKKVSTNGKTQSRGKNEKRTDRTKK